MLLREVGEETGLEMHSRGWKAEEGLKTTAIVLAPLGVEHSIVCNTPHG